MGLDDSVSASENQVELKLELRRIAQGQWFLKKFYEHARLIVVRTDLANRPTEPMLVSYDSRYTKLWGNRGFSEWVETDHSRTCWRNLRLRDFRSSGR